MISYCQLNKKKEKHLQEENIKATFAPANLLTRKMQNDSVAQLVEQMTLNHWVVGSSPTGVT